MSEERLIKWQQRYGALLEPGEHVRAAVFGDQQVYLRGTLRERVKRDLAAILANAESAAGPPST